MAFSEGVPPQQYLLMVQANELVPVNRKISAVASSLEELEAHRPISEKERGRATATDSDGDGTGAEQSAPGAPLALS